MRRTAKVPRAPLKKATSDMTTVSNATSSPFLYLPQEIRQRILRYAGVPSKCHIDMNKYGLEARPKLEPKEFNSGGDPDLGNACY